jgi:hypothetical protein
MSEFEVGPIAFGAIMVTGVFVVSVMMMMIAFGSSTEVQIEDLEQLSQRSALHLLENCLENDKEYLDAEFMSNNDGSDLCSVCDNLCDTGFSATVEIADQKIWASFGYMPPLTEDEAYEMYVNVEMDDDIEVGKLILRV